MRYRVLPYRNGSQSARELAIALGGLRLRLEGSRYRPRRGDVIINWGNTNEQHANRYPGLLNLPAAILEVSNKLNFFESLRRSGNSEVAPEFWTNPDDITDDAFPVCCRTVLAGHSGEGLVIANNREELVRAPLYTRYVKKEHEFRFHLGRNNNGEIVLIDVQQKRRRQEHENPNWQIRNLANGFIYARENIEYPECALAVARTAFANFNLHFGAVDVIYNTRQNRAYVLEINTAPGIAGTTISNYVNFFRSI